MHIYELRPRKDGTGFDMASDAIVFSPQPIDSVDVALNGITFAKDTTTETGNPVRVDLLLNA